MTNKVLEVLPGKDIEKKLKLFNIKINSAKLIDYKIRELIFDIDLLNIESLEDIKTLKQLLVLKDLNSLKIIFEYNILFDLNIKEKLDFVISLLSIESSIISTHLSEIDLKIEDKNIQMYFNNKANRDSFSLSDVSEKLKKYFLEYNIEYLFDEKQQERIELEKNKVFINIKEEFEKLQEQEKGNEKQVKETENKIEALEEMNKIEISDTPLRKKRAVNTKQYKEVSLLDVDQYENKKIKVTGQIFMIDSRPTKNNNLLLKVYIKNDGQALITTSFVDTSDEVFLSLSENDYVTVYGVYQYSEYEQASILKAVKFEKIENLDTENIVDDAPIKRVELNLHTNMSSTCSNITSDELIKWLSKLNHKAVAITDLGVLYSLPNFDKIKKDIKVIKGIDAYVVDDEVELIYNPKDEYIFNTVYTVFDIETTGLDSINDKIIEIGAVKILNNEEIDRYSVLIDPGFEISEFTTKLTGITNEMLKGQRKIEEVLLEFHDFIKDTTLVAHNAKFDVGFITQKSQQLNIPFKPTYIDSLNLARFVISDLKKFNLATLSNYFKIELENHHRALDDAIATKEIFYKLLTLSYNLGVNKLAELNSKIIPDVKKADIIGVTILAKNREGLTYINELVSKSHIEYFSSVPRIPKSLLTKEKRKNLLISPSVSLAYQKRGELVYNYVRGLSEEELENIISFYDYIQIAPVDSYNLEIEEGEVKNHDYIRDMNKYLYKLSKKHNKLVVAVSNVYYLTKEEYLVKPILEYIKSSKIHTANTYNYFRTTKEMLEEFSYLGTKESEEVVVINTNLIADQIENFDTIPKGFYPPVIEGSDEEIKRITYENAYKKYGNPLPELISQKIQKELDAIINNGFSVLYLTAQKLVKKSLDAGYPVGSRGSVGSSLVANFMEITEINSLYPHYICPKCHYFEIKNFEGAGIDLEDKMCPKCSTKLNKDGFSIPFEVFMGYNGDKVPDIDLNFSGDYQSEIHRYTEELFGKENVFRAGTQSKLAQASAYANVEKYKKALKLINKDELIPNKASEIMYAKLCENARLTTGQHPGGMVVIPKDKSVYEFTAIQKPSNEKSKESVTTHFEYHVMEQQLVKLDILGHDDPTMLKTLSEMVNIKIQDIPIDDKKILSLFTDTEAIGIKKDDLKITYTDDEPITGTNGIPEFGTPFVKAMLIKTKPKNVLELVRISGLSHGTNVWQNNAHDYIQDGIATLSEVISVRDDIMVYLNDQGLDNMTSFSIMEFVRKGQPKKNKAKWEEYRQIMKKHNIKDWYIDSCEKISYMFPKGHAAAYVTMALRIAYFKVYYPLEFYCAYLSRKSSLYNFIEMYSLTKEEIKEKIRNISNLSRQDKKKEANKIPILEILLEMKYRNIELLPIDIYKSEATNFIIEDGKIRIPLISMENLGDVVANKIIQTRSKEYISKQDLIERTSLSAKVLEALIHHGCMEKLSQTRQQTLF